MNANRRQRGFTLGEILASLAVAGITLTLAVPALDTLATGNHQATSVNQLVSSMHLARSEAVTRNAQVTVCVSRDGESCGDGRWDDGWIAFLDPDADQQRDAGEAIIQQVSGLAGLTLSSAEFARAFSYRANGRVAGDDADESSGEFAFCEPGAEQAARVVILRTSGMPALAATRRDGSAAPCSESSP